MLKKTRVISLVLIVFVITLIMILSSCSLKDSSNKEIQLWFYNYGTNITYFNKTMSLISNIKNFCANNQIPLKVMIFDNKTLNYEDYVLKRNIAAASGNMIIIEDAMKMWDLSEHHADYTKLKNYDNLIDAYKDRFCIPIGVYHGAHFINRSILDYYEIDLNRILITYEEYLEIKQDMKKKGAAFKITTSELHEMIDYFTNKHGLKYINNKSEILNNKDKLETSLKSIITDICDDIIRYNDGKLDFENMDSESRNVFDRNSNLYIYPEHAMSIDKYQLTLYKEYESYAGFDFDENNVLVVSPYFLHVSPSFYMYKKITNDRIYELADFIVSENSYKTISKDLEVYAPVFKGKITREILELDENLNYTGINKIAANQGVEKSVKMVNLINEISEVLLKNKETSKQLSDYYYTNLEYMHRIRNFVWANINVLSKESFDYKNEEINKALNNKIKEFVESFNIYYK